MGTSDFQISPIILPSITCGVATFPGDGDTIDTVVRYADEALYDSKKSGRNMAPSYEPFQLSI